MRKHITNYCPSKDKIVTIDIDYINASCLSQNAYIKGIMDCPEADKCNSCNNCPLYEDAPKQISM